jgi:WD40 repeat protein
VYSLTKRERNGVYDYREKFLSEHSESVTSLSWNKQNKLISGSKDNRVLLWSPSQNEKCEIFEHPEKVRVCKFFNSNNDYFVTGCKDNLLRVFSVSDKQPIGYYQLPSSCYSLDFDPSNKFLAVGLDKGEVMLYHIKDEIQLRLYQKKHCRNQQGIYSKGRKVVALKFLNHDWLLVTTADSRIRLMNYLNWTLVQKFKGHKNLNARIAPDFSLRTMTLVSGSEDGKIYFWKYDPSVLKNPKFECFQARDKKSTEYVAFASGRVEEEIRQRVEEGHVNHVIFSVGAKQSMKIFVVLSSD